VAEQFPIETYLKAVSSRVDGLLRRLAGQRSGRRGGGLARLHEAVEYALTGGGKRLRPALVLATCQALGGDDSDDGLAMRFALALEMVHAYSLVHDDLPCMDDDDLRRGRPTVHRAYDEATAVLVGDGLQSLAFRHLLAGPEPRAAQLAALLSDAAWRMVEGQALDMAAPGRALSEAEVLELMAAKTGALISAAVVGGAIAATGSGDGLVPVGQKLGLAFQIADDLLDLTGDAATLGKAAGKDAAAGKATLPALVGAAEARRRAEAACGESLALLEGHGPRAEPLRALTRFVVTRKK
jgi:farnesyl diphosphate synthase